MYTFNELSDMVNAHIQRLDYARSPLSLYQPIQYILSLKGKRLRPVLMLMAYNLYKESVEEILSQATGIEIYHNYTLLHDDLMDRADFRRGQKTVHKKWNDNSAILSGDAMLVLAYRYMLSSCPKELTDQVLNLFTQTALEICEGQQFDMDFENRSDVTEEEYLEMIRLKTSVLLACSLKTGALMAGASSSDAQNLYDYGINMGIAFQLEDDLLDVYGDPAVFGKKIGGDILCNKKTYLLIKALKCANREQLAELTHWIGSEQFDPQTKIERVTDLYNQIGVRDFSIKLISEYSSRAKASLDQIAIEPQRKGHLLVLIDRLADRQV